jgi:hypothetical protein
VACEGTHRLSAEVIERLRADFTKAVRTTGVTITYNVLKNIVEWGSSSYLLDDAVEEDPLYSQAAFTGADDDDKIYTDTDMYAIVSMNPRPSELRDLGLAKVTEVAVTIDAATLETNGIDPDDQLDRITIDDVEYDIVDLRKDQVVAGTAAALKNLCWVFGLVERPGRI